MSERAPCPSCGFTQICNCDVEPDPFYLPGEDAFAGFVARTQPDYGQLPDGVACESCACMHEPPACGVDAADNTVFAAYAKYADAAKGVERELLRDVMLFGKSAPVEQPGHHAGVSDEWQTNALEQMGITAAPPPMWDWLSLPAGNQLEAVTPSFSEKFLEKYGRFIMPVERECFGLKLLDPPKPYPIPEPPASMRSALSDARKEMDSLSGVNPVARGDTGPFIKNEAYNFPIMVGLEDGRLPPPLSDHAFALAYAAKQFARARSYEEECKALRRKLREADYQRELLAKTPEKIQQDAMAAAAEQLRDHAFVLSDEFRRVGSRDWYPGIEEGAPAPAEGFFTEIIPRISDFSRFSLGPVFTVPYHTFHITGIAGEMPKAKAPAFIRHLGESPEQVAMLLAQMSAPPGACSCQRINGFLFACLACSKAGKA